MLDLLIEAARYRALDGAFSLSPVLRSFLKKDGLVWTSLSRPGDDGFPLAVMVGQRGSAPRLFTHLPVRDPFQSEIADARFFATLGSFLRSVFEPATPGDWPQIVVGSRSDFDHLQGVAIRAAGVGDVAHGEDPSDEIREARMFGLRLGFSACGRVHAYGQQAVLSATRLLSLHVATGLSDSHREHLFCHCYAAFVDPGASGLVRARSLFTQQSSHRPNPATDAILGRILKDDDEKALRDFAQPYLQSVWNTVCQSLDYLERAFPIRSGHLVDLSEEEAFAFSRFRRFVDGDTFRFRDFRPRLRGGVFDDLRSTIEYSEAESSCRKVEILEVLHDPVVRSSMRLRDCPDFSWGIVTSVDGRRFSIDLASTSSNPDPRKSLFWIGCADPSGFPVFIEYREEHETGRRVVLVGLRGDGPTPGIGDVIQLYEKERSFDASTARKMAHMRIPQPSALRGTSPSPASISAVDRVGLTAALRSYRP